MRLTERASERRIYGESDRARVRECMSLRLEMTEKLFITPVIKLQV